MWQLVGAAMYSYVATYSNDYHSEVAISCYNHPEVHTRLDLLPHNGVLAGLVLGLPFHTDHLDTAGVERCWNAYLEA